MIHGNKSKRGLDDPLFFSLAAGCFASVMTAALGLVCLVTGLLTVKLRFIFSAAGIVFPVAFGATLSWNYCWGLFWWQTSDRLAGKVSGWQVAPKWFDRLVRFLSGDSGRRGPPAK
jgi:hypothetical protein